MHNTPSTRDSNGRPVNEELGRMTQYEVAEALRITRARVAEIERRALRKLRRILMTHYPELLESLS